MTLTFEKRLVCIVLSENRRDLVQPSVEFRSLLDDRSVVSIAASMTAVMCRLSDSMS